MRFPEVLLGEEEFASMSHPITFTAFQGPRQSMVTCRLDDIVDFFLKAEKFTTYLTKVKGDEALV